MTAEPISALDDRQRFTEERGHIIGSTDSPAILELSRWGTPLSVWQRLVGEAEERPSSLPAWLGARMENVVAELGMQATGLRFRSDNLQHIHPRYSFIGAHLDRRVVGQPNIIVELKTRSRKTADWGEDGTADIPPDIWVQVQHQMACVPSATETLVCVLFGLGHGFVVYRVPRDQAFIEQLLGKLVEFWREYVIPRMQPPATGRPTDTDILQGTPGGRSGVMKPATPEQSALVEEFRLALLNEAQATLVVEEKKNAIKQVIGTEADGLTGPFGKINWKRVSDSHIPKWKIIADAYKAAAMDMIQLVLDLGATLPIPPDLTLDRVESAQLVLDTAQDLYTETREGTRRFLPDLRDAPTETEEM